MSESKSFDEFDSLDDLYGYMMSDGGEYDSDMVRGYIDRLPRCRESAEEILENMENWDDRELYDALFSDFTEFLTINELDKAKKNFSEIFDDDLPVGFE